MTRKVGISCQNRLSLIPVKGEEASWKLGKEHDYCMKDGVYVGQDHETDYDDGESSSSGGKRKKSLMIR